MNTTLKAIICTYRNILRQDGYISENELLEMIIPDLYVPPRYKEGDELAELLDEIYAPTKWALNKEKRMYKKITA